MADLSPRPDEHARCHVVLRIGVPSWVVIGEFQLVRRAEAIRMRDELNDLHPERVHEIGFVVMEPKVLR